MQALDMSREIDSKQLEADCLFHMGLASAHSPQGVAFFEKCLVLRRQSSDLAGESICLQVPGLNMSTASRIPHPASRVPHPTT